MIPVVAGSSPVSRPTNPLLLSPSYFSMVSKIGLFFMLVSAKIINLLKTLIIFFS